MSPSWTVSRAIWTNAVLGERKTWALGWTIVSLALSALGAMLSFAYATSSMARIAACALPLAALSLFFWLRYVPGAVRQNSPANARLVPGLHRSVRRTTVLAWCLTMVPMALLASSFDRPWLAFVVLCVAITAIGTARGGRAIGNIIFVLVIVAQGFAINNLPLVTWLSSAPVLAVMLLMCVALAWDGMRTVFPAGGERHFELLSAQARQRFSTDMYQSMRLNRASGYPARQYALLLQRDLRPAARPEHLLLHALGPHNHRFDVVLPLVLAVVLAIAAKLVLVALGVSYGAVPVELISCFAIPLCLMQAMTLERTVVSMQNTRVEQSLVRLAPRAPDSGRLIRSMANQLLAIGLTEWLACGLALLGLMLLFGGGWQHLMLLATAMSVSLAGAGWALRDYAAAPSGALGGEAIVQTLLMGAGGVALFLVRDNLSLWSALLVLLLGCSAAIVHGRWNKMINGRLA